MLAHLKSWRGPIRIVQDFLTFTAMSLLDAKNIFPHCDVIYVHFDRTRAEKFKL